VSLAWAAEKAAAAAEHAHEPFYMGGEFWVAVAFVIFVGVAARTVFRVVAVALDDRADRIKSQIDEATRLAEEAQELLASYQHKQRDSAHEAEEMLAAARREAERISEVAAEDLDKALRRREQLAMERIAQAEAAAVAAVRSRAVEVALEATRLVLAEQATGKAADALVDAAIGEIPLKLKLH
jgi:F-type H+-transporting ATPase subunit b